MDSWAVEINSDWAVLCTPKVELLPFTDKFSLPVDLRIGKDFFNGDKPHVEVGLHNGKVAMALLVLSLVKKLPISVKRKEVGGFSVGVPIKFRDGQQVPHTLLGNTQIDATLNRTDHGLKLQFQQLSALLRLRQD